MKNSKGKERGEMKGKRNEMKAEEKRKREREKKANVTDGEIMEEANMNGK
jgi:hypothetical protein